jgi:hypothetical protein
MTIPGLLARGRVAAERLMLDTVLIERRTGRTFDAATGSYSDSWMTVYVGRADVKPLARLPREGDAGQSTVAVGRYDVRLPFGDSARMLIEDRVTVTASPDQHLVGRAPLFVAAVELGARRTVWHIQVVDQEQP